MSIPYGIHIFCLPKMAREFSQNCIQMRWENKLNFIHPCLTGYLSRYKIVLHPPWRQEGGGNQELNGRGVVFNPKRTGVFLGQFLLKMSEIQDEFLKSLIFYLQKCVICTSKKSSEKSSLNFEIMFEVFSLKKLKKKHFFVFLILKVSWFVSIAVNFLKSLGRNSKTYFTRASMGS